MDRPTFPNLFLTFGKDYSFVCEDKVELGSCIG